MANRTIKTQILLRNDTEKNWLASTITLGKGEVAIVNDKNYFKIGNNINTFKDLPEVVYEGTVIKAGSPTENDVDYNLGTIWVDTSASKIYTLVSKVEGEKTTATWKRVVTAEELDKLGYGDMLAKVYAKEEGAGAATGYVDKALQAKKVENSLTVTNGEGKTTTFDGHEAITISAADLNAVKHTDFATKGKAGIVKPGDEFTIGDTGELGINHIAATKIDQADNSKVGVVKGTENKVDKIKVEEDGTMSVTTISGAKVTGTVAEATNATTLNGKADTEFATKEQGKLATDAVRTVAEGKTEGTISVTTGAGEATDVKVHGLGSAAYTEAGAYEKSGNVEAAKKALVGEAGDASNLDTINAAKKYAEEKAGEVKGTSDDDKSKLTVYGVKKYAESLLADQDAMRYKGTVSTPEDITTKAKTALVGDTYKVDTVIASLKLEVGDMIIFNTDSTEGHPATYDIIQSNIDGAVTNSQESVEAAKIAIFDGTTGKLIKAGTKTIAELEAVATQKSNGMMSAADKTKLDNLAANSTKVEKSETNGNIKVNNEEVIVYTLPENVVVQEDTLILNGGGASSFNKEALN